MRVVALSDTHGFERGMPPLPDGDILLHCGDWSRDFGHWLDTARFARWVSQQPHRHKIVCPGNHDYAVWEQPVRAVRLFAESGAFMMGKNPLEIEGVTFDGGPWMPLTGYDPPWGFEMGEEELEAAWSRVKKADVLVSHTPPQGILDVHAQRGPVGCPVLRSHAFRIKPKVHFFGHMHECRGSVQEGGIDFVNVASNTRGTFVRDELNDITHMTMSIRGAAVYDL